MMNSMITTLQKILFLLLSALSFLACFTAQIGAGTASAWGHYQPQLPDELKR